MISVVLPNYNGAKYLAETIRSVQAQTLTAWELVIVDDGSTDNSVAIAGEFARQDARISVYSQENAGASAARNYGLSRLRTDFPYVLYLDSDDLLLPDALKILLTLLQLNPDAPAACGFLQDIDAEGRLTDDRDRREALRARRGVDGFRLARRQPNAPLVFGDMCLRNYITTPGQVLVRRSVLARVGAFDTSLSYAADYDLWWRLTMQSGPILVTSDPVLRYRHHSASMSRNKAVVRRDEADFRWRLLTHPAMSSAQRRTARLGYFYRGWAGLETGLYYARKGEVNQGLRHAALGAREMLLFARDSARVRRLSRSLSTS